MISHIKNLLWHGHGKNNEVILGATSIEYGLIAAGIAAAVIAVVGQLGDGVRHMLQELHSAGWF